MLRAEKACLASSFGNNLQLGSRHGHQTQHRMSKIHLRLFFPRIRTIGVKCQASKQMNHFNFANDRFVTYPVFLSCHKWTFTNTSSEALSTLIFVNLQSLLVIKQRNISVALKGERCLTWKLVASLLDHVYVDKFWLSAEEWIAVLLAFYK